MPAVTLGLISIALLCHIYTYINEKPPGMQTQLDSLILDNTRAWTLFTIWTLSILSIAVFFGPIGFEFAYALIVILTITVNLTLAAFTVTVIVKGVLVFKPDWFDEMGR